MPLRGYGLTPHYMKNTIKKRYIDLIKTAEMTYKLAHAIRLKCLTNDSNTPTFDYLNTFSWGKHTATHENLSLSVKQEDYASSALLHCTTYTMLIQVDTALEKLIPNRFKHENSDIKTASCIARLIRNAFAHDPLYPSWLIDRKNKNKTYEIDGVISLSTIRLEGKKLSREQYGGPLALLRFSEYVRKNILEKINI